MDKKDKKNIYFIIQFIMVLVIIVSSVEIITELVTSDIVNVDQIALYIFLIIGCLFVGVVFNGKASKIMEGFTGEETT